jgi:hypothetical protein
MVDTNMEEKNNLRKIPICGILVKTIYEKSQFLGF